MRSGYSWDEDIPDTCRCDNVEDKSMDKESTTTTMGGQDDEVWERRTEVRT